MRDKIAYLLSTGFYVGKLPIAPGTFGTLVAIPLILVYWDKGILAQISISLAVFFVGIWASTVVSQNFSNDDPDFVVIDEIAGLMVSMIGIKPTWEYILIAFILFRIFDILKPFPIKRFEKLEAGLGIMADDVVAGIYVLILMHIITKFI